MIRGLLNWLSGSTSPSANQPVTPATTTAPAATPAPQNFVTQPAAHSSSVRPAPTTSISLRNTAAAEVIRSEPPEVKIADHTIVTTKNWFDMKLTTRPEGGYFQELKFYRPAPNDPNNGFFDFANTSPCEIKVDGAKYPSTEHYFQCQGFGGSGTPLGQQLAGSNPSVGTDPMAAVRFARLNRDQKIAGWREGLSNHHMRKALAAKFDFKQHPGLATLLMETWKLGNHILVENSDVDPYWGAGNTTVKQGKGENKLGLMLMERRKELQNEWRTISRPEQIKIWNSYKVAFPILAAESESQQRSPRAHHHGATPYQRR